MAQQRDSIDLRTLEEVHRLLASSDFATADDRLARSARPTVEAAPRAAMTERMEPASSSSLPRRR